MRERLDCAVLGTKCTQAWVDQWLSKHIHGRLQIQVLQISADASDPDSRQILAHASMVLRRFDACLISVSEQNLAWARTALAAAQGVLQTPVLALVRQLKATALNDLYALGLADFVRDPVCTEELRARVEQLLDGRRYRSRDAAAADNVSESGLHYADGSKAAAGAGEQALCANILERSGLELDAFACASASRCATSKESFRTAKNRVIERFERAYITAALGRHSGNIAMAARAAQKHRRAFWALMRKHQIDAAPYRSGAATNISPDG